MPSVRWQADRDTMALYHADDVVGDVLQDSSGHNHHGRIVGATLVEVRDLPE